MSLITTRSYFKCLIWKKVFLDHDSQVIFFWYFLKVVAQNLKFCVFFASIKAGDRD